ncbi:MAG: hypothetical protein QOJ29_3442 [Thermoleophilaceae bacterium]|jgi:hypothetical protein|nr:hypothetical protein [Thermoleophilaceae bacterium]
MAIDVPRRRQRELADGRIEVILSSGPLFMRMIGSSGVVDATLTNLRAFGVTVPPAELPVVLEGQMSLADFNL